MKLKTLMGFSDSYIETSRLQNNIEVPCDNLIYEPLSEHESINTPLMASPRLIETELPPLETVMVPSSSELVVAIVMIAFPTRRNYG